MEKKIKKIGLGMVFGSLVSLPLVAQAKKNCETAKVSAVIRVYCPCVDPTRTQGFFYSMGTVSNPRASEWNSCIIHNGVIEGGCALGVWRALFACHKGIDHDLIEGGLHIDNNIPCYGEKVLDYCYGEKILD